MAAKTPAERKRDQRQRDAERRQRFGGRVMQFEMYQGTADALDELCRAFGVEQPAEVLTHLIHSAAELRKGDRSRFEDLLSRLSGR